MISGKRTAKKRMPHSNSEDKGSKFALNREIADLAMMLVHEDDSSNGIN